MPVHQRFATQVVVGLCQLQLVPPLVPSTPSSSLLCMVCISDLFEIFPHPPTYSLLSQYLSPLPIRALLIGVCVCVSIIHIDFFPSLFLLSFFFWGGSSQTSFCISFHLFKCSLHAVMALMWSALQITIIISEVQTEILGKKVGRC